VRLLLKTGHRLWIGIGMVWMLAVVGGMRIMLQYETTASAPGDPPNRWPAQSRLPRKAGLPTIVVVAHPKCPCTRATIGELAVLMTRLQGKVSADVVFVRPQGTPDDWDDTELRRSAARIPGVTVSTDLNKVEANLFEAQVSGQTMLYDAAGELEFSGGITASRGHSGDNVGRSSIVSFVTTGISDHSRTPVFGCVLRTPKNLNGATF
jgi:hypothetical protein